MVSSNDSAADCTTSGNDTASAPAASGDTAEDFTYSYSAVQKEGVQADASPFDTYDTEDGADDRSADASGGYAIITLDVPAAAEFLHERGMAVYAENDEYVRYLVVAEAAHDLADAMELPEAERTALRQADDILIVEVAKTAPAVEEPAENTPQEKRRANEQYRRDRRRGRHDTDRRLRQHRRADPVDLFRRAGADGDFIRCILPTRQGQGGLPCPRGDFLRGGGSGRQIPRREHNVARRIGAAAAAAVTAHARAQLRRGVVELFRAHGGCSSR